MERTKPPKGALTVLPELSALPSGLSPEEIKSRAEERDGPFERALGALARARKAYVAGSYPERAGERVFHTVALAGPDGAILCRYRATHPAPSGWATPGDEIAVIETPLGRIGLATAEELATPELGALYAVQRTDILAAPAGAPSPLKVEIDSALFGVADPPTGRADFFSYAAAKQNQLWLVSGGRRAGDATAAGIYGPEPVVSTPTLTAAPGAADVRHQTEIPAVGTWIDQSQLIAGQQAQWFVPLTQPNDSAWSRRWRGENSGRQNQGP